MSVANMRQQKESVGSVYKGNETVLIRPIGIAVELNLCGEHIYSDMNLGRVKRCLRTCAKCAYSDPSAHAQSK